MRARQLSRGKTKNTPNTVEASGQEEVLICSVESVPFSAKSLQIAQAPAGCWTGTLPVPGSRGLVFLDSKPFPLAMGGSCLREGLGRSLPFLMTTRTSLCSCAWCRTFRTSPWAKPANEAPLTDRRKSPRLTVPSWEAAPWENTLWIWDRRGQKPSSFMTSSKSKRANL